MFDLLVKGGTLVDPAAGFDGPFDVAVRRGRIAAVDRAIPADSAARVIDATGHHVTPGLVDLHTHIYRGVTFWGVDPDTLAWRTGVTTWIDAGSAGAFTLQGFRELIAERTTVRVYALLNISTIGLVPFNHELSQLDWLDVDLAERMAVLHSDFVVGVKVRMGTPMIGPHGFEPMKRAHEVAKRCALPLMVHISYAPPSSDGVLRRMRPGDILTHCWTGLSMRLIDEHGQLSQAAKQAMETGVVMDIAHGTGSFSFRTAEILLAAGYKPDVISTDVHQMSVPGPMFDLPTCMSKLMHLGMSFPEVVRATTSRPAEAVGLNHEVGTLRPGALADLAIFAIDEGTFPLLDSHLETRTADRLIRNVMTVVGGHVMDPQPWSPPAPWIDLTLAQQQHHEAAYRSQRTPPAIALHKPGQFPEPPPAALPEQRGDHR